MVMKLKKSNCDKTKNTELVMKLKTQTVIKSQIVMNTENLSFDEIQKHKL